MKLWFHSKSGKAPGANNGTSRANAWNSKHLWSVARKFIRFIPLFLLMGCQGPAPVAVAPKEIFPPALVASVVRVHQQAGYQVQNQYGVFVVITNGPNKGTMSFFGISTNPVYLPMQIKLTGRPITVQGSNNLTTWADLFSTNAGDFYFNFVPQYQFYRTKS